MAGNKTMRDSKHQAWAEQGGRRGRGLWQPAAIRMRRTRTIRFFPSCTGCYVCSFAPSVFAAAAG